MFTPKKPVSPMLELESHSFDYQSSKLVLKINFFYSGDFPLLQGEEDDRMIGLMVDLWTNFATFHDPTPSLELKTYQVKSHLR